MPVRPPRDEDIDYDAAPDDGAGHNSAAGKSRALGCFFLAVGAAAAAGILFGGAMPEKLFAVVAFLATCGAWMEVGMVLFPWTEEMFALNKQDDFGKMFRGMPTIWKAWFVLLFVILALTLVAVFTLTERVR